MKDWQGDKIAGQHDQIWFEIVGHSDGSGHRGRRKKGIVVKVAQLDDRQAIKRGRETSQRNLLTHQTRPVGLKDRRINTDGERSYGRGTGRKFQKTAS